MRPLLTPRAYSGFCLSAVASRAAKERAYPAAGLILYRSFWYGFPRAWRVAAFFGLGLCQAECLSGCGRSFCVSSSPGIEAPTASSLADRPSCHPYVSLCAKASAQNALAQDDVEGEQKSRIWLKRTPINRYRIPASLEIIYAFGGLKI